MIQDPTPPSPESAALGAGKPPTITATVCARNMPSRKMLAQATRRTAWSVPSLPPARPSRCVGSAAAVIENSRRTPGSCRARSSETDGGSPPVRHGVARAASEAEHAVALVHVGHLEVLHERADLAQRRLERVVDLRGDRGVGARLLEHLGGSFAEGVPDLVREGADLHAVLVDQTLEVDAVVGHRLLVLRRELLA